MRRSSTRKTVPPSACSCVKRKTRLVAEYALRGKDQPLGVAEYQLVESLPAELQTSLPSIEQIERELAGDEFSEEEDEL